MKKTFNVTGACNPEIHYMVDIHDRLKEIKNLVDNGAYFTINRARQYGKTTTLRGLQQYLSEVYIVIYLDFQFLSQANFRQEETFVRSFVRELLIALKNKDVPDETIKQLRGIISGSDSGSDLGTLFFILSEWCAVSEKPIVLMIDEVDSAANNQVFMDFLAQLRGYYIHREIRATFQSVILAGVYDIKNMKRKLRTDDEHKLNSPWNIAADFDVVMSLSEAGIAGMLREYERDHHTGMDLAGIAGMIYEYTSGYPFLVSRICKLMDERLVGNDGFQDLASVWTTQGFHEAVKMVLSEKNTLFESLINKLSDYPELRNIVYTILFNGKDVPYNSLNKSIEVAEMFGFIKNSQNKVAISNRIFETILYNYFLSEELVGSQMYDLALQNRNQFVEEGRLNMKLVLEKFVETFDYLYGDRNEKFIEDVGRKYFMLFLKPIINGT